MARAITETPTAEEQRLLVERIVVSNLFRKSHKLAAFLKFICEQHRLGHSINEQRIGTEVFGRNEGYHMGEDSIVRSQARFLRLRLQEYFATEGRDERIMLTIPKGSYVPEFHYREANAVSEPPALHASGESVAPAQPEALPLERPIAHPGSRRRWIVLAGVLTILLAALALIWRLRPLGTSADRGVESRFWASIFDPQRTVLVVPSDSTLILLEELSGKQVSPSDYMSRKYLEAPPPAGMAEVWESVTSSKYTNMADLNLVARLERVPEVAAGKVRIRFARDLSLKELKESNAILIGGARANPWVRLFDSYGHFRVDYDSQGRINFVSNRDPGQGEQTRYDEIGEGPQHLAYGVIAYVPSLDGDGSALLVGGTSKAGTEAAAEFLFSTGFANFLRQMDSGSTLSHFEILLSTQNLNGDSYYGKIVSFHRLTEPSSNR